MSDSDTALPIEEVIALVLAREAEPGAQGMYDSELDQYRRQAAVHLNHLRHCGYTIPPEKDTLVQLALHKAALAHLDNRLAPMQLAFEWLQKPIAEAREILAATTWRFRPDRQELPGAARHD